MKRYMNFLNFSNKYSEIIHYGNQIRFSGPVPMWEGKSRIRIRVGICWVWSLKIKLFKIFNLIDFYFIRFKIKLN